MNSDTQKTGRLYPKLDAYCSRAMGEDQVWAYMCSTCQYKTMKSFKAMLNKLYVGREIKVRKATV